MAARRKAPARSPIPCRQTVQTSCSSAFWRCTRGLLIYRSTACGASWPRSTIRKINAPIIHIAGTNGKGSTAAMLRAILEAQGHRVHAYHSPHLTRFHERIILGGEAIAEPLLEEVLGRVEAANQGRPDHVF